MKIALGNQMINTQGTLDERLRQAREAGFDGVEFWLGTPDVTMESTDEEVGELAETLRECSLQCSSIASTLGWGHPITSPDDEVFERAVAVGCRQVDVARICNADAILVVTGRVLPEVPWRQAWDRMVEGFRRICDYAMEHRIRVGAETCPSLSKNLMTPGECAAFVSAVARPNIGIYLDIANVLYSGYPRDFIRELGDRIVRIHAKDREEPGPGGKGRATWPGNGIVDWKAVCEACADAGYDEWAVLEFPPPEGQKYGPDVARRACEDARKAFNC